VQREPEELVEVLRQDEVQREPDVDVDELRHEEVLRDVQELRLVLDEPERDAYPLRDDEAHVELKSSIGSSIIGNPH
jgi:hypothetical protein